MFLAIDRYFQINQVIPAVRLLHHSISADRGSGKL